MSSIILGGVPVWRYLYPVREGDDPNYSVRAPRNHRGPKDQKDSIASFGVESSSDRSWIEMFDRALFCTPAGPRKEKLWN